MIDRLRADVTAAIRGLISTPVTTLATALLLAVAVGANLAVFGLIDRAILTPARHVVHPDRLFTLSFGVPGEIGAGMTTTSYVAFTTLRDHAPANLAGGCMATDHDDGDCGGRPAPRRSHGGVRVVLRRAGRGSAHRPRD